VGARASFCKRSARNRWVKLVTNAELNLAGGDHPQRLVPDCAESPDAQANRTCSDPRGTVVHWE
ncbi:MAG: hypothetical protein ACRDTT_33510, partial [Pseudonocardiaceae bacterium]